MAVITKYFVVRNGVEIDKVFEDKKEADAYDKMLDAAEKLAEFIKGGDIDADIDDKTIEQLSVFLAQKGPEVIQILKGVKPVSAPVPQKKAPEASKPEKPKSEKAEKNVPAPKAKKK